MLKGVILTHPFSWKFFCTMTANYCGTSIPMYFSSMNLKKMFRLEMLLALVTLMELLLKVNVVV